jgi:hypothetical protein
VRHATAWMAISAALASAVPARSELRSIGPLRLNPMDAAAVERALGGAARRLQSPECRRIFSDFRDAAGAPLQDRLDAFGVSAPDYLSLIVFADGSGRRSCQGTDIMAVTTPGSRVVYVCGRHFAQAQRRSPARAEVVVLHEALHTLGLGENPPDNLEISRRVAERCALTTPRVRED